jgi:hypothetical protein
MSCVIIEIVLAQFRGMGLVFLFLRLYLSIPFLCCRSVLFWSLFPSVLYLYFLSVVINFQSPCILLCVCYDLVALITVVWVGLFLLSSVGVNDVLVAVRR